MRKNLLLILIFSFVLTSCENESAPSLPRQLQIESITFTELPKFIDIIDYDDMETFSFSIKFNWDEFQSLVETPPFDLKSPAVYNSTDGLLQPLVFEIKNDFLPFPPDFQAIINFERPNVNTVFTDRFIIPELEYTDIYNDDLAEVFEYEYQVTYTPEDGLGRLDGTFRYTVKGRFFY